MPHVYGHPSGLEPEAVARPPIGQPGGFLPVRLTPPTFGGIGGMADVRTEEERLQEQLWGPEAAALRGELQQRIERRGAGGVAEERVRETGARAQAQQQAIAQMASARRSAAVSMAAQQARGAIARRVPTAVQEAREAELQEATTALRELELAKEAERASLVTAASQRKFEEEMIRRQQEGAMTRSILQGILQAGATAATIAAVASDVRTKQNINPGAARETYRYLEGLDPIRFQYRPEYGGGGQQVGITAQSAARTPMGSQMVTQRPDGMLGLDPVGGMGAMMAAQKELHERIKTLEGERRG